METKTFDFVLEQIRAGGPRTWPDLSTRSGVPLATIQKIAHSHTTNPRVRTVEALARGMSDRAADPAQSSTIAD